MGTPRKLVLTGISGRLGRIVARALHRDPTWHLIGIDRRPFIGKPKDVEHHQVDLRTKRARDVFRHGDITALVHLGVRHDPRARAAEAYSWNVTGTSRLLEYCQAYRVPKVVLLSSADVYGPRPENPQFLTEDAPLLAAQRFPQIRDLVEVDHMVSTFLWRAQQCDTVVLRPVHILGSVRNAASNYLRLSPIPTLLGFDPLVQPIHVEDVAQAIVRALSPGARGIYNIVGPGELPLSAAIAETGRPTIAIPHPLARPLWSLAFRLGFSGYPVDELDFIRFVGMIDGRRAREELGYRPLHGLRDTIRAVDDVQV
ncbi:MAG: NAD-dependent epimerase/dehydratase family protein [Myxococcales bacterium]|nr:NAD-dependent epimerase/dehydratase family protein [Myxococcales bacterium]